MGKLDVKEAKKAQIEAASRDYIVQPRLGRLDAPIQLPNSAVTCERSDTSVLPQTTGQWEVYLAPWSSSSL